MINSRDIIFISNIEWDFLWQSNQEIASRLARAGNRILYVENTGVRAPTLHDAGRVASRLKQWFKSLLTGGVREVAPNLKVCTPLVLPPFGSSWQRRINRRFFLRVVTRIARRMRMRDPLIWTFLPSDTAVDLIKLLGTQQSVVIYYSTADFLCLTPHAEKLRRSEQEIAELSDLVFANCQKLATRYARWNAHVHVFPVGVNIDAFPLEEQAQPFVTAPHGDQPPLPLHSPCEVLADLPQPIIGYIGGLHRHVDFGLLAEMARTRPDWSWVCVGAVQAAAGELSALPNVHLLGRKPHTELVTYMRRFDVCIVPYALNDYTETVVPTKIKEYLAAGKPVVSTELPTVCDFNEQYKILITARARPECFLQAIETALDLPDDPATKAGRREVALKEDWQARLESMSALIEARLKSKSS